MFLKCAMKGKANYLISDDFKSGMHNIDSLGFKVLSAKDFCEMVKDENEKSKNEENENVKGCVS